MPYPDILYHGTSSKFSVLRPQPVVSDRERMRVKSEVVLYATEYFHEALVHGVSKSMDLPSHASYVRTRDGEWKINIPLDQNKIKLATKVYIYALDIEGFTHNDLDEWTTDKNVKPLEFKQFSIAEALGFFNEVIFDYDRLVEGRRRWL